MTGELDGVPMALYVQDAHPIREAMDFVRRAEARGFAAVWQADSRLVREATVPMAAFAAPPTASPVGSGVIDIWTRNPARLASVFSTLDDLAPGRILAGLGAWWDPLAAKVGIRRAPAAGDARGGRGAAPAAALRRAGHLRRGVRAPRRGRARLRPPGAAAQAGADLHRRHRHADDGAGRRDRRRRRPQLPGLPGLQRAGAGRPGRRRGGKAGRTLDDVDRPQLVVCSLDEDREAALDAARLLVTQYLGQQPHIMAASGVPQALLEDIGQVLTWPATHEQVVAASKLVPDEIVQMLCAAGHRRGVPGQGGRVRGTGCTSPILYPLGDVEAIAFSPRLLTYSRRSV